MFYIEGWIPLVEVVDRVEVAIESRYRGEGCDLDIGSNRFYDDVYAAIWRICDACSAGIIAPGNPVMRLSRKLFTRNRETSQFGDYLCLTIGQIGSCYARP